MIQIQSFERSLIRTLQTTMTVFTKHPMKKMLTIPRPENSYDYSGLYELTDFLVTKFKPEVTSNKSVFINEIPAHLELVADKQLLSSVLNKLFSVVASYTKDSCIRLSAKKYGNTVLIKLKESSSLNRVVVEKEIVKLKQLAEQLHGSVGITGQRKLTTITFGFPNLPLN